MKFLFSTDEHIMGTSPRYKKDNFTETVFNKLREVNDIARNEGVIARLNGGDLFHIPDTAPSIVREACIILRQSNAPLCGVIGNHTIFDHNPESFKRAMIGILEGAGIMNLLSEQALVFGKNSNGKVVAVTGAHYSHEMDINPERKEYLPHKPSGVDILIHVVHGFLTQKKWPENVPHTIIEDIAHKTEADIILAGHEHLGFGVININGKLFCNPGALTRSSASKSEIDRVPRVAIVDTDLMEIKFIPLECAKAGEEVLDREKLEKELQKTKNVEEFVNSLTTFDVQDFDIMKAAESFYREKKVSKEVYNEAVKRIQGAKIKKASNVG